MFLSKGYKGIYYLYYIDEITGKKRKISTKTKLKSGANLYMKSFNPVRNKQENVNVSLEFLKEYTMNYVKTNLSKSSQYVYETIFRHLQSQFGNKDIKIFTIKDIESYKTVRLKSVSRTSVNIELRTLKALFNYAIKWGFTNSNPVSSVRFFSVPEKERLFFNENEIEIILKVISDNRLRNIVLFGLMTGCRLGEILNLQWKDVDFQNQLIKICNKSNFKTKSGKIREIPISDRLNEIMLGLFQGRTVSNIMDYNINDKYVFCSRNDYKFNLGYISRKFKKYLRLAGLPEHFHFHCLRHTCLTQLARAGISIYHLKQLAGHSDIKITEIYLHTVTEDLRSAVNKIKL